MQEATGKAEGILLEFDCDRTINFAMQQNDVPIIRQLRVTNGSAVAVENLRVRLSSEPQFFPTWETSIASIPPGGTYALGLVDLRPSASDLMGLTERVGGSIRAELGRDGHILLQQVKPIEMLAFDEWGGMAYSLPELLAAFVLPNHPIVEAILTDAAKWLGQMTGDSALSGYQSRSPTRVGQIAQAIYVAIQGRGLNYCNPPASFESTGQKIRLPDRIMDHRLATCLDLAVLFAACLEQSGLFPLVVMTHDHAFVGVWLIEECFADCATDERVRLRKRVDLGEILVIESTLVTAPPPNDFATAVTLGKRHLADESEFRCAIDIQRCRKSRIRPLPVRTIADQPSQAPASGVVNSAEAVFSVVTPTAAVSGRAGQEETAATRLDKWKRKLLDLTLNNRLINFKPSKKTVQLLCPDLAALENALADGLEFQVLPRPTEFGPDTARSTELHVARTGTDALDQLLIAEAQSRRLRANMGEQELRQRLTEIYRTARTAMEEGGASALYLALGFVAWYETDTAEQRRLAPIILLPVEIRRTSVQEGFRLCQSDEEPRINITLLEMLTADFDLRIPGMEPIPQDEHGIDVRGILTTFRQALKNASRWDVVEEAQIGFFSFTKFLMWRDLEQRTQELLRNKVVDHLVNRPNESFPGNGAFPEEGRLDEAHRPHETFCPLPSDSSQLAAVYAAADSKSFVLFGPPGTGKSQTITNLIAHSLANNKSVLFVSEKMAALNVVHHRLEQCGLKPFCLELHSNKMQKRHVVEQLGQALDYRGTRSPEEWGREAERLAGLRAELNAYVHALHQPRGFGESVFQATSRLIGLRDIPSMNLNLPSPNTVTRQQLDRWRDLIEQIKTATGATGHPSGSPWSTCGIETWSPAAQRAIEADIDLLLGLCDRLDHYIGKLGRPLGLGATWNLSYLEFAEKLVTLLTESPRPPASLLTEPDWDTSQRSINEWAAHGRKRDGLRQTLYAHYDARILQLDLDVLGTQLKKAKTSWFIPRWLRARAVKKALAGVTQQQQKPSMETLARHISEACTLREEEKWLASAGERAEVLLGGFWKSAEADWKVIEALRDWTGRFRKLALAAAGGSPDKADAFRKQWARLVADGDDALKPNGVLGKTIAGFLSAYVEFTRAQAGLESGLAGGSTLWGAEPKRVTLAEIRKRLESWKANRSGLRAWCNWRLVRRAATEAGLGLLIATYEGEGLAAAELRKRFDRSFYEAWIDWITEHDTTLQRFFSPEHERKIQLFRDADDQYVRLTRAEIQTRLAARRPRAAERVNEASEMGILQRQRQLRRGHMPVRQLFQKIPHLLPRIKPCILMSPISVAQYLDASHPPFDLVVFDEASQIPTWDAVGAIARGQEVVIVGDPKQLPPTSFFTRADDQEANDEDLVEDMESILDECLSARLPQMLLNWHYRSRHESLIAFSNYHYYENRLLTFPSPFVGRGVSYRHVPTGVYDKGQSRTNRGEAEAVVAEVLRRLCHPVQSRQTIGIVTFSVAQQGLVEDLLDEARQRSPEIEPFFASDAPEPVFVKNLENVQGDERDVILFSVCYGPDAEGRVSVNFGPLNRDGGERRLNVAITRARSEVIVFATLKAEQIDLGRSRARGVQDLKCFLDYADRGPVAIAQALILRGGDDFESPFEKDVCQRLRACGYEVHSQVGCSGYRIDLAIVDPEAPGRYVIGIECDGANYHSAKTARDRDRLREGVLVGLGWRLHRVWSSDWWANPDECMAKLDAAIEQAKLARTVASPAEAAPPAADQGTPETEEIVIADEPPEKPESDASPVYRAYRVKRLLGAQQDFYAPTADSRIRQLIREIVLDEGPVALDLAARRVAAHWGLGRLGSNIRDRIERIARAVDMKWVQHEDRMFLWPPNLDPATYSTFRAPGVGEEEQRDIDEIPPEEIGAAAVHVLKEQVSLPMEQLTRETALVLGFQRAGQTIQRIVGSALELAEKRGTICRDDRGNARLPD